MPDFLVDIYITTGSVVKVTADDIDSAVEFVEDHYASIPESYLLDTCDDVEFKVYEEIADDNLNDYNHLIHITEEGIVSYGH